MKTSRLTVELVVLAVLVPLGIYGVHPYLPALGKLAVLEWPIQATFPPSTLAFTRENLGHKPEFKPLITNVQIVDLDRDGIPDVLACDAVLNRVVWYRQAPAGSWEDRVLGDKALAAPCHVSAVDLDKDGDLDLVVALLGSVNPADEPIGKVVWLENDGKQNFTTHLIRDDLYRVADVQAGDLNGDGLLDLVVADFGFVKGRVLWLENKGNGKFLDHELFAVAGAIHVPIVDLDGDGKLDIVTVVSQEDEEVWAFENLGAGHFKRRSLYFNSNFDLGSSGLFVADINGDGKPDLLLTAGDNLEISDPAPQPWHGCILLENQGNFQFKPRRLASVPGVYAAGVGDLNGDGHPDIVLASIFNNWRHAGAASLVWLENDGKGHFKTWQIADAPSHLATVAVGDLNGDGLADIVAGGLHLLGPYDRLGRVTLWSSKKGGDR